MSWLNRVCVGRSHKQVFLYGLAIVLVGLLLRLYSLERGLWYDEVSSLQLASTEDFWRSARGYDHPPLYFLILRGWIKFTSSPPWLRLLSVFFSCGTIVFLMLWLRLINFRAVFIGGWLAACSPGLLSFSQEIRGYALLACLTSLSLWALEMLLTASCRRGKAAKTFTALWLGCSLCAAVAVHLVAVFFIPALVVYSHVRLKRLWLHGVLHHVYAAACAALLLFILLYSWFLRGARHSYLEGWWMPQPSLKLIASTLVELLGLPQMLEGLMFVPPVYTPAAILFFFGCLGVLVWCLSGADFRPALPSLLLFLTGYAGILLYSIFFISVFISRTLLFLIPPLIGSVALLCAGILQRRVYLAAQTLFVMLSALGALRWVMWEAPQERVPWSEMVSTLDAALATWPEAARREVIITGYPFDALVMLEYKTGSLWKGRSRLATEFVCRNAPPVFFHIFHYRNFMPQHELEIHNRFLEHTAVCGYARQEIFSKKGLTLYRFYKQA